MAQSFKDFRQRLLPARRLHQPDLLLRQAVQLIDQPIDLPVRGLYPACDQRPLVLQGEEGPYEVRAWSIPGYARR